MSVSIVTPWLNHLELWEDYQGAVQHADQVVIVDDGSDPPLEFATVRLDTSTGFSHASNVGLAEAIGDRVVWLNNDIAGDPDWLEPFAALIEPGVLVGRLRTEDHARVPGVRDPLTYIDGWCLGGMRDDLNRLRGFDETFKEPAYYSDNDLCLRARCLGMTLRDCRPALHHKLSTTTGGSAGFNLELQAVMAANHRQYAQRARTLLASVAA